MNEDNYSLTNLQEWIEDALYSEATPEEIYDCIVHTVQRRVIYHKKCMNDSQELLNLIDKVRSTTRPDNVVSISEPLSISDEDVKDVTYSRKDWDEFWKSEDFILTSPLLDTTYYKPFIDNAGDVTIGDESD